MQEREPKTLLFLGGCRSGKSRLAEEYVISHFTQPCYVATMMRSEDSELHERIAIHQEQRGDSWLVVEEPKDLCRVLACPDGDALLIDCLTMWLTNLLLADLTEEEIRQEIAGLIEAISTCPVPVVLVANEVGLGIVPDSALGRSFRDLAGWLNQQVAGVSQRVIFVAAGLPLTLKDV